MKRSYSAIFLLSCICIFGCNNQATSSVESIDEVSSSSDVDITTKPSSSIDIESSIESESTTIEESSPEVYEIDSVNTEPFRLSSISDIAQYDSNKDINATTYKVFAPYDDTYEIECKNAEIIKIYNDKKNLIASGETSLEIDLQKDQIVYLSFEVSSKIKLNVSVNAVDHYVVLPYEINSKVNVDEFELYNDGNTPLKPCEIKYTKRDDGKGLYINCNNPEALNEKDLNKCFTRQDVTGKDVFFTFEHNNISSKSYYYGYRVTNTDDKDIFVTIKNIGYQISGKGTWLGEDEWIKFYNIPFESLDPATLNASQRNNYNAYIGFGRTYKSNDFQPITYRIPKGKYIYVMGGTTKDSYNKINVAQTADKIVQGSCGNGAVIFSVTGGSAEGSFLCYTDSNAKTINESEYVISNKQQGYVVSRLLGDEMKNYGSQYVGYDNCHGVVDSDLVWVFNDKTKAQSLPVKYDNPYYVLNGYRKGTPYSKITNFDPQHIDLGKSWSTHINPNYTSTAIGTDMTNYITIDNETGKDICIDVEHYDGRGEVDNIGNWMVDYIDTITLVNQGNTERAFTYSLLNNGVQLVFVRDEKGFIDESYTPRYCMYSGANNYGDEIDDRFIYSVTISPHSVKQFSVNYNLLANSYGNIKHSANLV